MSSCLFYKIINSNKRMGAHVQQKLDEWPELWDKSPFRMVIKLIYLLTHVYNSINKYGQLQLCSWVSSMFTLRCVLYICITDVHFAVFHQKGYFLLTYPPHPNVGHKATMSLLHRWRSWAITWVSPIVRPMSESSVVMVLLHVVFGRPLLRFPVGVHLRATFGI